MNYIKIGTRLFGWAVLFSIAGCALKEQDLAGQWRAVAFYENGKSVAANLDSVSMRLSPDGGYEFRSQGFYRESGSFRVSVRHLYVTDTTEQPPKEHVLRVLYLSRDSLKIKMRSDKKEQVLFFARQE